MGCELGDFQRAYDMGQEGLRMAKGTGDGRAEAFAHRGARTAAQELGLWAEALAHARAAQAGFISNGHQTHAWVEACMAAQLLHAMGEPAQALADANALLLDCEAKGGWGEAFEVPFGIYRLLTALGDERARALLNSAHQLLTAQASRFAELVPTYTYLQATMAARGICEAWDTRAG